MKKLKLSIVTCTHNPKPEFLEKAVDSVENQTFNDFEHIINDSQSNKLTLLILKDYIKRNRKNYPIKFIQTKPGGVAKALNDASELASGEIIHFLHSDDYYVNNTSLKRAMSYFDKKTNWITGNFIFNINGKSYYIPITKLMKLNTKRLLSTFTFISHENTFMRTKLLKKYGGFSENIKGPVELRLWIRMVKKEHLKLVDETFTVFRVHRGSTSRGGIRPALMSIKESLQVAKEEGSLPLSNYIKRLNGAKNSFLRHN